MPITFNAELHEYRTDAGVLVPGVTSILKDAGLVDTTWFTDYARERGSAAHLATALWDRGELDEDSVDDRIRGYLNAWCQFRRDSRFGPNLIEEVVYNEAMQYAGTFDRAGVIGDRAVILDIKTGAMSPVTGLQLAAYQRCKPNYRTRLGVQLKDNGTYRVTEFMDRNDWNVFAGALALVNWKHNNGVSA